MNRIGVANIMKFNILAFKKYLFKIFDKIHTIYLLLISKNFLLFIHVYIFKKSKHNVVFNIFNYKISLNLNKHNINFLLWLFKLLRNCTNYSIIKNKLIIKLPDGSLRYFEIDTIINKHEEFLKFLDYYPFCHNHNIIFNKFNLEFFVIKLDGILWKVRSESLSDIKCGPFLPYFCEPIEYKWFSNIVKNGTKFIDIGASIGGYTLRACIAGANVIAIEPHPKTFSILSENLSLNNCNSIILNVALGSLDTILPFYMSDDKYSGYLTLHKPTIPSNIAGFITVKKLDSIYKEFFKETDIIDLIRIDVEGFEFEVLKGGENVLKKTRYLILEIFPENKNKIFDFLSKNRFILCDISNSSGIFNAFFKNTRFK